MSKVTLSNYHYGLLIDSIVEKQRSLRIKVSKYADGITRANILSKIAELDELKVYLAKEMYG